MMKSASRWFVCAAVVITMTGTALAQSAAKIGVINSQEILEKSAEGKKAISRLQEKERASQAELNKLNEEIRQLENRLNTQQLTLSQESALQLNAQLDKKRTDQKRRSEDALRELQELQFQLFNKIQNELIPIINQLGQEKGQDLILDLAKSGAVYINPAVDMTAEVIRRYDAQKAAPAAK